LRLQIDDKKQFRHPAKCAHCVANLQYDSQDWQPMRATWHSPSLHLFSLFPEGWSTEWGEANFHQAKPQQFELLRRDSESHWSQSTEKEAAKHILPVPQPKALR
jgi:hypothetical protein